MRRGHAASWTLLVAVLTAGCERINSGAMTSQSAQADESAAQPQQTSNVGGGDVAGGDAPSLASPSAPAGDRDSECPAGMRCEGVGSDSVGGAAGERCAEASDCASQVCGANGLCCAGSASAPGVDCCASASDCPDSYRWLARCHDPATCQGSSGEATCIEHACGTRLIEDDAQCAATTDCGLFAPVACNLGLHEQPNAGCKAQCETDEDCHLDHAFCEAGECRPKLEDLEACDRDRQCTTRCAANHLCCATDDCCNESSDCPKDPGTCTESCANGRRKVVDCAANTCIERNNTVEDDSACDGMSFGCGPYADVTCNKEGEQSACPTSCMNNSECDADGTCGTLSSGERQCVFVSVDEGAGAGTAGMGMGGDP